MTYLASLWKNYRKIFLESVARTGFVPRTNAYSLEDSAREAFMPFDPGSDWVPQVPQLPVSSPQGRSSDVERTNEFDFYEFGKRFAWAQSIRSPVMAADLWWHWISSERALAELQEGTPCPIGLSRNKAAALQARLRGMIEQHCYVTDAEGKRSFVVPDATASPMEPWEVDALRNAVVAFETVFGEEMREAATYRVPPRGIYSTPKLVDSADDAFPDVIKGQIPEKALADWKSAGRCLAFNLLTASGFHVARAIEAMLERYYQVFCGKAGTKNSLYDYVTALEKVIADEGAKNKPSEKIVAELTQLKDDWRNPLMHPRVTLTETDAHLLFTKGEGLILGMAQELSDHEEKSASPKRLGALSGAKT